MIRSRPFLYVTAVVILIPVLGIIWWLASPLFISRTVEESFPTSVSAVIPEGMTAAEVEPVMAGMAKLNEEVSEMMAVAAAALKSGSLRDGDSFHKGCGEVTIYRLEDGSHVLRLQDLRVTNGPDLHVLLSDHPDPVSRDDVNSGSYVDLGRLKGNLGSQNYEIPADVDLSQVESVVIYCKPFQVVFSVAPLREVMAEL